MGCQPLQGAVPVTSLALKHDKLQMGGVGQCAIFIRALAVTWHTCVCYIHLILSTAHFLDENSLGQGD